MSDQDTVNQLYTLMLQDRQAGFMQVCLTRAKALGGIIHSLSGSQLNGLADLAKDPKQASLDSLKKEIFERNTKRWKNDGFTNQVEADVRIFHAESNKSIQNCDLLLKQVLGGQALAQLATAEVREAQFARRLFQIYITAAVTFARVKQSDGRN